ncbi:MAG: hypothetical protein IPI69_04905 [Bacteroidales bacterium]|nr:hypothetical protein [Bacteroidales bacterium]
MAWGSRDRSKRWLLDEAGSYGYLVKVPLGAEDIKTAAEKGKLVIRIQVNEVGSSRADLRYTERNGDVFCSIPA